jgi:hypothetical protein
VVVKRYHAIDWVLPVAFAAGGGLSAWIGYPRWYGVTYWFLTLLSGFVLGAQLRRWRRR